MGLFGSKETQPVSEWPDEKLIKEIKKLSSLSIVAGGKLIIEAQKRGLRDPKTGKPY